MRILPDSTAMDNGLVIGKALSAVFVDSTFIRI